MAETKLLEMKGITKRFPGVVALDNVHFDLNPGEVHVLLGENGAGKSTLIKVLSGVYQKDEGETWINGQQVEIQNPHHAQELGISTIYQELNLISQLDIARNVFLGREPVRVAALEWIDYGAIYRETQRILDELDLKLNPRTLVRNLGVAQQQMVELAKALSFESRIMIMDEPTAALTDQEIRELFDTIRALQDRGVGIIYISHRLQELSQVGNRVTVLRDGSYIGTQYLADVTTDELISMMVGRTLDDKFPKAQVERGEEALRVEGLSQKGILHDINLVAHRGEITGIAGLMGAGRTEMAQALFGITKSDSGRIYIEGQEITINSPRDAIDHGLAYLPEDRKGHGLVLLMSVANNIIMAGVDNLSTGIFINEGEKKRLVKEYIGLLNIRTPGPNQQVQYLSGGNQQKVVLAKWLLSHAKVIIFDEPTRGVDVGAKVEVYQLMNELIKQGAAIIMISSELPEILAMSDRILVMREGSLVKEFTNPKEVTEELVLGYATGGIQDES
jgi:ribose transport system ATP-binding protein